MFSYFIIITSNGNNPSTAANFLSPLFICFFIYFWYVCICVPLFLNRDFFFYDRIAFVIKINKKINKFRFRNSSTQKKDDLASVVQSDLPIFN